MTRSQFVPCRTGTLAAAIWLSACGCGKQENGPSESPGPQFHLVSLQRPVAWGPNATGLVVQRLDRWVAADAARATCNGTGLYVVDSSGRLQSWKSGQALCDVLFQSDEPRLSPDGRLALYAARFADGAISRLNLEDMRDSVIRKGCLPVSSSPAWSPDGRRIAYLANCTDRSRPILHLMNADGSGTRPVGTVGGDSTREDDPTWAPSGRHIAVARRGKTGGSQMVVLDTLSGSRRVIANGARAPVWSPVGDWIAYLTEDSTSASPRIRVVRFDGSEDREVLPRERIPRGSRVSGPLVWSPDGRLIAFARVYQGGSEIWIVGIDGQELRALSRNDR